MHGVRPELLAALSAKFHCSTSTRLGGEHE
jgi:hypothetical protein